MIDLEPYIYRPHPVFRLPSREDAEVACKTPEGEKEFREAMHARGLRIYQEATDPYRYGYEPPHWAEAKTRLRHKHSSTTDRHYADLLEADPYTVRFPKSA